MPAAGAARKFRFPSLRFRGTEYVYPNRSQTLSGES